MDTVYFYAHLIAYVYGGEPVGSRKTRPYFLAIEVIDIEHIRFQKVPNHDHNIKTSLANKTSR